MISVYEPPSGRGVRVDGYGYAGYRTNPRFDSLLAKVIVHADTQKFADAAAKAERALSEFRIAGVPTNIPFLRALLRDPRVLAGERQTRFIDEYAAELVAAQPDATRYFEPQATVANRRAGAKLETTDPLGVVDYGRSGAPVQQEADAAEEAIGPGRHRAAARADAGHHRLARRWKRARPCSPGRRCWCSRR